MKPALFVLLALIVPPAIYFPAFVPPHRADRDRLSKEENELQKRIEWSRAAKRKIVQFHDESARLDRELEKVDAMVPSAMQTDEVRSRLESAAAISGVRITTFEPRDIVGNAQVQEQDIDVEAVGGAGGLAAFYTDLAQPGSRLMFVSNLGVRRFGKDYMTRCFIEIYALPVTGGEK